MGGGPDGEEQGVLGLPKLSIPPTTGQGQSTHPTVQESPLSVERQTEVTQGGWGRRRSQAPEGGRKSLSWMATQPEVWGPKRGFGNAAE